MNFESPGDFFAILFAPVPNAELRLASDKSNIFDAPTGALIVIPRNVDSSSRWSSLRMNLTVGFEPGQLDVLAEQEFGAAELDLQPPAFGHVDQRALQIAQLVKQELSGGPASEIYVDSLMTALGIHIIRNYSGAGKATTGAKAHGGLSPRIARQVEEYLRERLSSTVSVAELAALCDLSPGAFIRAFTKTFGAPPHRYLINLRLSFSAELLAQTELPISEIAHSSGFSSQSHLTSTMRKYRHTTPAQIRGGRTRVQTQS
ncbi:AraC family transcriptional regulator [Pseudorhizobium tarimense]|uniref:AraC family transcriptional regulator n=1 Tax=Pseudorhizobium tarimense TaxID=1079109 RepID=A0ABV2HDQ3_9HYPH|nr:AraC family transcriptional regulator [Pseudorhizobium tarimense]